MIDWKSAKKLTQLITNRKLDFLAACCFVFVLSFVELPLPIFMAILIDNLIPSGNSNDLIIVGLFLFAFRASASIFQVMQNFVVARIINSFVTQLRKDMFSKIIRLPWPKFLNAEANGMATRFTQDVDRVSEFAQHTIHFLIRPALSFIFITALMMYWNFLLALYCLLIFPAITLVTRIIRNKMERYSREQVRFTEKFEAKSVEALSNIKIIRTFTCEPNFIKRTTKEIESLEHSSVQLQIWTELANKSIDLIKNINNIGFILIAAWQVFDNRLSIGEFVAMQTLAEGLRSPIAQIVFYLTNFKSKSISLERTQEVIDQTPEQKENLLKAIDGIDGDIKFQHINLSYGNKKVLKDVSFEIKNHQMVALVGPSGAGKTTLSSLLMGLIKPDSGQILINDQPLDKIDIYSVRKKMGVVYQESILFNNTVRYNMKIGNPNASDDDIWRALEIANANEFISNLPNKLESILGVNGIKLSGGQQQRLSIARAVLANPAIIILDEATSSLDSTSELEIKDGLDKALKGRTSLVIAHRLSTILNADKILVIEDGCIVEEGTHKELIQNELGLYYQLYKTQTQGLLAHHQSAS